MQNKLTDENDNFSLSRSVTRPGWGMPDSGAGLCVIGEETFKEYQRHLGAEFSLAAWKVEDARICLL